MQNAQDLKNHLQNEHRQSPFSEYLKEIVYGGIDGIVTTFAVVAGFSGAQSGNEAVLGISVFAVLLFGFANLFADGVSMALGNFLSTKAEQDVYRQHKDKERKEIFDHPQYEIDETIEILKEKGFSDVHAQSLVEIYKQNPEYWVGWMMDHELKMSNPEETKPALTALATFFSFIVFGAIPLMPYVIFDLNSGGLFPKSVIGTFIALLLLGVLKGRVVLGSLKSKGLLRSVLEVVFIGGVSAIVAYIVGTLFTL